MQPTKALNPAAPPFFPAAWASKKVAVTTFPDQMVRHLSTLTLLLTLLTLLYCRLSRLS